MTYENFDNKKIQSFEYETTINSDGNILGVCELGKATIQLLNNSNEYSTFKGSWIHTIHGSFYVYDVSPVQEKVNIKLNCYDIKYKLDSKYDSTLHTFPCTLKEWRNSIFDACDVEYDNSDFPNSSLILNQQPYIGENPSNRNVIALIAQAGASFVVTDENDKFWFKWFTNIEHKILDWLELTTERNNSNSINRVVLGRGDVGDDYPYPNSIENPVEFRIDNNYILDPQDTSSSTDLRATTIIPIYNRVNNFSYLIFNMRTQKVNNKLSIKLGDKIKFNDIWGNELVGYVMTKKIKYLGGALNNDENYEITLSSSEVKETSTEIEYSSKVNQDLIKISRKADANNATIEDIINQVGANGTVTSASIILAINNSTSLIKLKADKLSLEGITTINDGFIVNNNGKVTMNDAAIHGGNIELIDTGSGSDPTIEIYDETAIASSTIKIGDKLNGKTLDFLWPTSGTNLPNIGSVSYKDIIRSSGGYKIYGGWTEDHGVATEVYNLYNANNEIVETLYFAEDYSDTLENFQILTSLSSYTLPDDFGIVNYVLNTDAVYDLINTPNIKKKTTKFTSEGTSVIDRDNNIDANYGSHGLSITDVYGTKYFNENGLLYMTNYGPNFGEVSANDKYLFLEKYINGSVNRFIFDCDQSNAANVYLECIINSNLKFKVDNDGAHYSAISALSSEKIKKNIEKLEDGLSIIKNVDIYKYHLKSQDDNEKKHIGFVIGDKYKYSEEITNEKNNGADIYSMIAVAYKAIQQQQETIEHFIQEQQETIEHLKEKIKALELRF